MSQFILNCIAHQPPYSAENAWDFLQKSYPPYIVSIFQAIANELRSIIPNCGVAVLGSFSTAKAQWLECDGNVMFISDIDLMATMQEEELEDVILKRDTVTSRLSEIAKSIKNSDKGFHIGIRYRTYKELNAFVQKTSSVGYSFWDNTLWIQDGTWRIPLMPRDDFSPGHCAENICNMLWVVLRYSRPPLWRSATRTIECMQASVEYLSNRLGFTPVPIVQPLTHHNNLALLKSILLDYGQIALNLAQECPDSCRAACQDEEFDFFRVVPNKPALLPLFLVNLLKLAWNLDEGNQGSIYLKKIISLVPKLGLINGQNKDEITFENLRYSLAAKRVENSPLFNRDRGPNYLASFQKMKL